MSRRQVLWRAWDRHGWAVLGLALVGVVVLSLVGLASYDPEASASSRLYATLKLFTVDGVFEGPVPWTLDVARWLAPVVTAAAAAEALAAVARRRLSGWSARLLRGHLIVVGAGSRGTALALDAHERGTSLVVVESDAASPGLAALRHAGIPVVLGDGSDPERLLAAGLRRATRLIAFTGTSSVNVRLSETLHALSGERRPDFAAYLEVRDGMLLRELQGLVDRVDGGRQELFNLAGRAGPILCDRYDPVTADRPRRARPVVVVGDGPEALSVVGTVASRWEAAVRDTSGTRGVQAVTLLVPVSLPDHASFERRARATHPAYAEVPSAETGSSVLTVRDLDTLHAEQALDAGLADLAGDPGLVVVACDDDAAAMRVAVHLSARWGPQGPRVIVVGSSHSPALDLLARTHEGRISLFCVDHELCTEEAIVHGRIEELARALHDGYLRHLERVEDAPRRPAARPWTTLDPTYKESNRAAARSLWDVLRAEGMAIVPRRGEGPPRTIPVEVRERLAEAEHERWRSDHHDVPGWADLDEFRREQTRDQVARYPGALAAIGLEVTAPLAHGS